MGSTKVEAPKPPAQPTMSDQMNQWAEALPKVYETQLKYAPLEAQQQLELAQKYAGPLGQAMYDANKAMYPETVMLQEKLAGIASKGMDSGLPDWAKESYRDTFRSQLGDNALAGAGADYMSRGMMSAERDWRDYYQNLGLTVAGRQPLATPGQPMYTNQMGSFSPAAGLNYGASTYGDYSNAYQNMYNTNAQMKQSRNQMMGQIIGGAMGGIGAAGGIGAFFSSRDFKDNIRRNDIDSEDIIRNLDIVNFEYKGDNNKKIGIILEDSPSLFNDKNNDGKYVDIVNMFGVLLDVTQKTINRLDKLEGKYV